MKLRFILAASALLLVIALAAWLPKAANQPMQLTQPIACKLGDECFIQNYVDTDAGKGWKDYSCGPLTYDGHKGTDYRLKNLVQMREGVKVLAAAPGVVLGRRDGMDDTSIREENAPDIAERECGNGVLLGHKNGWQTQYCHLKKNSITLQEGDDVLAGTVLGEVGLSGATEFPHLHFQVRNPNGEIIDPFTSHAMGSAKCAQDGRAMWDAQSAPFAQYISTGLLSAGFSDVTPNARGVREGEFSAPQLSPRADAIIFWSDTFGLLQGDVVAMSITDPSGVVVVSNDKPVERNKAQWFQFVGKKRTQEWPEGTYRASYKVLRKQGDTLSTIISKIFTIDVIDSSATSIQNPI